MISSTDMNIETKFIFNTIKLSKMLEKISDYFSPRAGVDYYLAGSATQSMFTSGV